MTPRLPLLLCTLLICFTANAQHPSFEWAKGLMGANQEYGECVLVDGSGNVYLAGSFDNEIDLDPGPGIDLRTSVGSNDIYLVKLDPLGNLIWGHTIGDSLNDLGLGLEFDASGDLLLSGGYNHTVDFDPGPGITNRTTNGNRDAFIARYTPAGNFVWVSTYGNAQVDHIDAMAPDDSGNVYIAGQFRFTVDFDPGVGVQNLTAAGIGHDSYLLKLDQNGDLVWIITSNQNTSVKGLTVTLDQQGNPITAGDYGGTLDLDFGAGIHTVSTGTTTTNNVYVHKMDPAGNFIWGRAFSGTMNSNVGEVHVDAAGNTIITGQFQDVLDLDPGVGTANVNSNGSVDVFVVKLDANGDYIWGGSIGGTDYDRTYGLTSDPAGNIFFTGNLQSAGDIDPGPGTMMTTYGGFYDAYVVGLDASGGLLTTASFSDTGFSIVRDIQADAQGNLWLCGEISQTSDMDPGAGQFLLTSSSSVGAFVTKWSVSPSCQSTSDSINVSQCGAYTSPSGNFTWNTTGTYQDTLVNAAGCDSILTIDLIIYQTLSGTMNASACDQFVSPGGNHIWTSSGTYQELLTSVNGCDSLVTIHLIIHETSFSTLQASACNEYTAPSGTQTWTTSGTYTDTLTNTAGCDSIITINLTVGALTNQVSLNGNTLSTNASGVSYQWIDCADGQSIAGANAASFTPTASGTYAVVITQGSCLDTSTCQPVTIVGIGQAHHDFQPSIYPNPSTGHIQIDLKQNAPARLTVRSITGELVEVRSVVPGLGSSLDLSRQPAGTYLVEIRTENQVSHHRLILR